MQAKMHLITLIPSPKIGADVKALKEEIKMRFGAKHALKLPAHLTLQRPFWVPDKKIELLHESLHNAAEKAESFPVNLNGFDCFSPRVIFIKITHPEPIIELQGVLQSALPSAVFLREKERQTNPIHPHITLATRDLQHNIFPLAWRAFKTREYQASFPVNSFRLFQHDGKYWHKAGDFSFEAKTKK